MPRDGEDSRRGEPRTDRTVFTFFERNQVSNLASTSASTVHSPRKGIIWELRVRGPSRPRLRLRLRLRGQSGRERALKIESRPLPAANRPVIYYLIVPRCANVHHPCKLLGIRWIFTILTVFDLYTSLPLLNISIAVSLSQLSFYFILTTIYYNFDDMNLRFLQGNINLAIGPCGTLFNYFYKILQLLLLLILSTQ